LIPLSRYSLYYGVISLIISPDIGQFTVTVLKDPTVALIGVHSVTNASN
jgi:hypothetical protein